jgi:uncharacterized protein (DUF1810 family)
MSRLERFKTAQDTRHAGFDQALAEIRAGAKTGHWIWYVFPQIAGLGMSGASQAYAIADEAEAAEYLEDPVLRSRLLEIATAVAERLRMGRPASLLELMGSEIDARKVVSSLTLFGQTAKTLHARERLDAYAAVAAVADEVLRAAAAQGYPPCRHTLHRLGAE